MNRRNPPFLAALCAACLASVLAGQAFSQEKPKPEPSPAQQEADKAFAEARQFLIDKGIATAERIEQAVETRGREAVIRFARARGWQGGGDVKPGGRPPAGGKTSIGLTPLTDLAGEYKGQSGGLYPGGKNTPPEAHLKAALAAAAAIRPLDAEGRPAEDGKIVLISNGMSNTTQEFSEFVRLANQDKQKSPRVVIVDCAQGGMEASMWADPEKVKARNRPSPWDVQDRRLREAGVSPQQVQVVWIKQARAGPAALGAFPKHARVLQQDLVVVLNKLKQRFPNLRLAYLSSRIYAGYAVTGLNPEPYAYESAFSVRWLIEDQMRGAEALNYDADRGEAKAPLVLWGPYLWADGVKGRQTDDLVWESEDLGGDGTHPSGSGRRKVAALLLAFFKTDPTARPWFAPQATSSGGRGGKAKEAP